jgi:hypothetical protein
VLPEVEPIVVEPVVLPEVEPLVLPEVEPLVLPEVEPLVLPPVIEPLVVPDVLPLVVVPSVPVEAQDDISEADANMPASARVDTKIRDFFIGRISW